MLLTYEWHKAIKLNYINTRINAVVVLRVPSTLHGAWIFSSMEVLILPTPVQATNRHAGTINTAFHFQGH